jgi:Na+/melibiose symporter-like transporter
MKYNQQIDENNEQNTKSLNRIKQFNKISYFLIAITFGLQGIVEIATQFFFKNELQLQPAEFAQIQTLILSPWLVKPIYGLLSDMVPIFGYRRKYYIILSGITATLSYLTMAFFVDTLTEATIAMIGVNMSFSFLTVLGEAIVVELSKLDKSITDESHNDAKKYVSYFFLLKNIGSLIAACFKGVIVKYFELRTVFLMAAFLPCINIISGIILIENKVGQNNDIKLERVVMTSDGSDDNNSHDNNLEAQTTASIKENKVESGCSRLFNFVTEKRILMPTIFIILFMATPSYDAAMFYFFTEDLKLDSIDLGYVSLSSTISVIIAIVLYRLYFQNVGFKKTIIAGSLVYGLFSFLAFLLVTRANKAIGIPDMPLIITSSSVLSMIGEIVIMPLLSLAAILSPKDFEGTAYSVFMSAFNLGFALSGLSGSLIMGMLNIKKDDYHNLKWLVLIANISAFLPLPFLCFMDDYKIADKNKEIEFSVITKEEDLGKHKGHVLS